jgi:hypothetical protein
LPTGTATAIATNLNANLLAALAMCHPIVVSPVLARHRFPV